MAEFRQKIRKVIAPIAFLVALGVLASQTCRSEMAEATVVVEAAPGTAEVELELLRGKSTERLGFFRGRPMGNPPVVRWSVQADSGDYQLSITTHGPAGTEHESRGIRLEDRATITISLGDR
ncbi:MAG: hypothetical protein KJO07_03645 [Deltaproteobacteria bacterium]|nr:hypothetical protein [Deltaproteobacteria bacterium]